MLQLANCKLRSLCKASLHLLGASPQNQSVATSGSELSCTENRPFSMHSSCNINRWEPSGRKQIRLQHDSMTLNQRCLFFYRMIELRLLLLGVAFVFGVGGASPSCCCSCSLLSCLLLQRFRIPTQHQHNSRSGYSHQLPHQLEYL